MRRLLLYDPLNMGHHPVYADNFTAWGLSRGLEVVFCGYDFRDTFFFRKRRDDPRMRFLDLDLSLFDLDRPVEEMIADLGPTRFAMDKLRRILFEKDGPARQVACLKRLQEDLRPEATVVLYGDEMWPTWEAMAQSGEGFPGPTWMVLIYANGLFYDPHSQGAKRLRPFLERQRVFDAVFTLDEHQPRRDDPSGRVLRFLPDPYRQFEAEAGPTAAEAAEAARLERFLEGADFPLLAVLGLLEGRKHGEWLLGLLEELPGWGLLLLGKRNLPERAEALAQETFDRLARKDALFASFRYVPESFFEKALDHPRVGLLPLPYARHDGSSGIHLLALERGVPCLVPDSGLSGRRTLDHGLGRAFRAEDEADFRRAFRVLSAAGRKGFAPALSRFAAHFGREPFEAALDRALEGSTARTDLEACAADLEGGRTGWPFSRGLSALGEGRAREAADAFGEVLRASPGHPRLLYLRAVALGEAGDGEGLTRGLEEALSVCPGHPETAAYVEALCRPALDALEQGGPLLVPDQVRRWAGRGPASPLAAAVLGALCDRAWQWTAFGRETLAVSLLEEVLRLDPERISALHALAVARMRLGRFGQALETLDRGLALEPGHLELRKSRAAVLARMGRHDEALAAFGAIAAERPDQYALYLNMSDVCRYARRFDQALSFLDQVEALGVHPAEEIAERRRRIRAAMDETRTQPGDAT